MINLITKHSCMAKKIVIVGAGTYGSYLAHCLIEKYPDIRIDLYEVGEEKIKSEEEIGYLSKLKAGIYNAASSGRFFGLGGTSAKWGGQLLFFSKNDFAHAPEMEDIVACNMKYKDRVLSRFFKDVPILEEREFKPGFFIKQGVWLKFQQRNLFNHFELQKKEQITIHRDARVVGINANNGVVSSISVKRNKSTDAEIVEADLVYLTAGAFESLRLMHVSGLVDMDKCADGFSDHVSYRCFKMETDSGKVGSHDFQFRFNNGSMITSRLVGEIDDVSFYIHPIFNEEFNLFQFLKQLIFKGKFSAEKLLATSKQFFHIFPFTLSYLVKKKLYIYKSWYLNIDMELSKSTNSVALSEENDAYNEKGIAINYNISSDTTEKLLKIKEQIRHVLQDENIRFSDLDNSNASSVKLEDIYHPYKMFIYGAGKSIFDIYNPVGNLYLFNTGLLNRSGGINPTASLFCLIEYYLENNIHI